MTAPALTWFGIVRLGLVQTALGAIVVLATSTVNRVMVVELALPALVPGLLVGWHNLLQVLRPGFGHGSDVGGRRLPWIIGGMAVLALGGVVAAASVGVMAETFWAGIACAVLGYALIGVGAASAGTSLLVLLAQRAAPHRRAAAATIVWVMMIAGFAVTPQVAGRLLDPYSPARLVAVSAAVAGVAFAVAVAAAWGMEGRARAVPGAASSAPRVPFRAAIASVWADPKARRFSVFIAVSMLAYSAQELLIEPFAGAVFGLSLGQSTKLVGTLHGGLLVGMILAALSGSLGRGRFGSLRAWTLGGCLASALALLGLAAAASLGLHGLLTPACVALGVSNGVYAASAIGLMMQLAAGGGRDGVRMGVFGAAQGLAFGAGGVAATGAVDLARLLLGAPAPAYAATFVLEAALFLAAALVAARLDRGAAADASRRVIGNGFAAAPAGGPGGSA